jgi:hypothetical protein
MPTVCFEQKWIRGGEEEETEEGEEKEEATRGEI